MRPGAWWQDAVIYQVVVPSFADSDGDGLGDLPGLIERLDYLEWLGVDALWLSPIYPSPLRDLGYDVTDLCAVDPRFGSLEALDLLVAAAHHRNIRVLLDWIPNHTAADHPWFREARSSRTSPKRDWYIWRDPDPERGVPSNWISVFGGSVWEWDPPTGQYYLHTFLDSQPDLNWRNPAVRAALFATLRFWLERGVDGFRIDALCLLLKDEQFRDNPPNPDYQPHDGPDSRLLATYTRDQPGLHEIVRDIRKLVDSYGGDRALLGEFYLPTEKLVRYYGWAEPELHLPLNLLPAWLDWAPSAIGPALRRYHDLVPAHGWPTTTLSTHDSLRIAARTGADQARNAALFLMTQRGTPTHYYGEEIGMQGVPIPPAHARDPQGRRTGRNRDPERTPMQWTADDAHGGFTRGTPWLPLGADLATANVARQRDDPRSLLALYRRLIALRREQRVLIGGAQEWLDTAEPVLAYRRTGGAAACIVALNFGAESRDVALDRPGNVLLSTTFERADERCARAVRLGAHEGVIVRLDD